MRSSSFWLLAPFALFCVTPGHAARMRLQCQHNVDDGRTLIANGDVLPEGAAVKIISYKPVTRNGSWTYGPCVATVTRDRID